MKYNKLMKKYLLKALEYDCSKSMLIKKMSSDFIEQDDCYILKYFFKARALEKKFIDDKIGYECNANGFHVIDFVKNNFFEEAFCFTRHVFKKWRIEHINKVMIGIISIEFPMKDAHIRFHLSRPGELQWLDDNLENYKINGILLMNSNDDL